MSATTFFPQTLPSQLEESVGLDEDTDRNPDLMKHTNPAPEVAKFQDPYFAIAFIVNLLATIVVGIVVASKAPLEQYQGLISDSIGTFVPSLLKAFAFSTFAAIILSYAALALMKLFPTVFIHLSMIINLVSIFAMIAISTFVFNAYWSLFGIIFLLLWGLIYYWTLPFISFIRELLSTSSELVMKYPSTLALNCVSVLLQFACSMFYSWLILQLQSKFTHTIVTVLTVWQLFSFYWTLQFIRTSVHTTNCGVFATWYFMAGTFDMPASPLIGALKRTFTYSFGSVSFGSLIVAIIQTLRTLLRTGRGGNDFVRVIVDCVLSCLESITKYVNHYAFVFVATYGTSYLESARATFDCFFRTGLVNLLNDNVLSRVQVAVCSAVALLCAMGAYGINYMMGLTGTYIALTVVSCFVGGWLCASITLQVLESAVATIYVCFAQDSQALQRTKPALYDSMISTFGGQIVASNSV